MKHIVFKPLISYFFCALLLSLSFLLFFPASSLAQDDVLRWIGGDLGKARPALNYQFLGYSTEEVAAQGKDFKMTEHRLFTLVPFLQSPQPQRDASVYLNLRAQDVRAAIPPWRDPYNILFGSGLAGLGF